MPTVLDITVDQPPAANLQAVRGLTAEEAVSLAEELTAYHQHFSPFFYRREQREWAEVYLRGLLTAMFPVRMWKRWPCACWGWDHRQSGRCGPCNSSLGRAGGTMRRC